MITTAIDRGLSAELAEDLAATALTLAKRFAAGATMWSIAPSWEPHALHIAVEFVHPVIMGKRALPAVALTGSDLVDLVRVSVRPGDIVVAISGATVPTFFLGYDGAMDHMVAPAANRLASVRAVAARSSASSALSPRSMAVVIIASTPPPVRSAPRPRPVPGPARRRSVARCDV